MINPSLLLQYFTLDIDIFKSNHNDSETFSFGFHGFPMALIPVSVRREIIFESNEVRHRG